MDACGSRSFRLCLSSPGSSYLHTPYMLRNRNVRDRKGYLRRLSSVAPRFNTDAWLSRGQRNQQAEILAGFVARTPGRHAPCLVDGTALKHVAWRPCSPTVGPPPAFELGILNGWKTPVLLVTWMTGYRKVGVRLNMLLDFHLDDNLHVKTRRCHYQGAWG